MVGWVDIVKQRTQRIHCTTHFVFIPKYRKPVLRKETWRIRSLQDEMAILQRSNRCRLDSRSPRL